MNLRKTNKSETYSENKEAFRLQQLKELHR